MYNTRYIPFFVAAAFKGCCFTFLRQRTKKKVVGLTLELFLVHLPFKKKRAYIVPNLNRPFKLLKIRNLAHFESAKLLYVPLFDRPNFQF